MKRLATAAVALLAFSNVGWAEQVPALETAPVPLLQGGKDPALNAKEWAAAKLAYGWISAEDKPTMGKNGQILYLYGATLPTIVCAPLKVCDLELQPGERVKDLQVSDTVRWQASPGRSGPDGNETTHVLIKPTQVGIEGNMVILTDRRTYHLKLLARKKNWMPRVAFAYPEDISAEWQAYHGQEQAAQKRRILDGTGEKIDDLDFGYDLDGDAPWKPVRVYNNGLKTVIEMPNSMRQTEAPALLVLDDDDDEQLVNYRVHGDRYIVDQIFTKAVLIAGVGSSQTKITIERN